ncbi:hypothetical protein [Dyadobacter sp. 676]|uniref:Uncharacterized protein n=1 Tax=Dyadobacter sp. 676 TaxID=3088362 RepID=A0AAU8FLK9_9BACT
MIHVDPYIVHHDSEDDNNKNISTAGQVVSNPYIHRDTNGFALQFWIGYGTNNANESSSYMSEFPNLGFSYGVFSSNTSSPSLANGSLYVDDENTRNANTLTKGGVAYTNLDGYGVTRVSDPGNTRYNFMKVR